MFRSRGKQSAESVESVLKKNRKALQGSADTLVRRGGKLYHISVAYFL